MTQTTRLNLGAGDSDMPGFEPVDIKGGRSVYPLDQPDGSVGEIYASHVLEHLPRAQTLPALQDWFRAMEPGGRLRVCVPDFDAIRRAWDAPEVRGFTHDKLGRYLFGGQTDEHDFHYTWFNRDKLTKLLQEAGFERVDMFQPVVVDCSALPVSLNMVCYKPDGKAKPVAGKPKKQDKPKTVKRSDHNVAMVLSMPRLTFTQHYECTLRAIEAARQRIGRLDIVHTGGFPWEAVLEQGVDKAMALGHELLLFTDFDSTIAPDDLVTMLDLMDEHPQIDALFPVQAHRHRDDVLVRNPFAHYTGDITETDLGHFGLTLIRADVFRTLPKPWLWGMPNPQTHAWDAGKTDPDIFFWRLLREHGHRIAQANQVVIGHMELGVKWPTRDGGTIWQSISSYRSVGKPKGASMIGYDLRKESE